MLFTRKEILGISFPKGLSYLDIYSDLGIKPRPEIIDTDTGIVIGLGLGLITLALLLYLLRYNKREREPERKPRKEMQIHPVIVKFPKSSRTYYGIVDLKGFDCANLCALYLTIMARDRVRKAKVFYGKIPVTVLYLVRPLSKPQIRLLNLSIREMKTLSKTTVLLRHFIAPNKLDWVTLEKNYDLTIGTGNNVTLTSDSITNAKDGYQITLYGTNVMPTHVQVDE